MSHEEHLIPPQAKTFMKYMLQSSGGECEQLQILRAFAVTGKHIENNFALHDSVAAAQAKANAKEEKSPEGETEGSDNAQHIQSPGLAGGRIRQSERLTLAALLAHARATDGFAPCAAGSVEENSSPRGGSGDEDEGPPPGEEVVWAKRLAGPDRWISHRRLSGSRGLVIKTGLSRGGRRKSGARRSSARLIRFARAAPRTKLYNKA